MNTSQISNTIVYNTSKAQKASLDNYMTKISEKNAINICAPGNKLSKNVDKNECDASKINVRNYSTFNFKIRTVTALKEIAKTHELKTTGKKDELLLRICSHFYFSSFTIKIQRVFRGQLLRCFLNKMHGPAAFNRNVCVNQTDFLSMEEIKNIPINQFFSYKDVDGFVYGFDVISFHNLIVKCDGQLSNPYNRSPVPPETIRRFKQLIKVGKIVNMPINVEIEEVVNFTSQKTLELRILNLFQHMNSLGNYAEPYWFSNLDKAKLIKFMRELFDIWNYRLQITLQTKLAICPPNGNPFRSALNIQELINTQNIDVIRNAILTILELFVNSGIDRDSRCLGSYYVLGALTMVSDAAAATLPWLYQSMTY
jgi:hypothetical protein